MDDTHFSITICESLSAVSPADWDRVANPDGVAFDPCLSWNFLEALERSGAVSDAEGWSPHHLIATGPQSRIVGALPLYLKSHSYGEFVFDHSWADAYNRAGGRYYPKLLSAGPFTPVTGRRCLVPPGPEQVRISDRLVRTAMDLTVSNGLSSFHINFVEADTVPQFTRFNLLHRTDQQFHWRNNGYDSFDAFLAELSSAKRKTLRKERAKAQEGLTFSHKSGSEITEADWDAMYAFYLDTGSRKWGSPYLNRDTFSLIGERMAEHILLIFAEESGKPIAGAMNLIGGDRLLGRYWGTTDARPMLHFETCYYQAIDWAIAHGIGIVEAGAQGGHKLARGYEPVMTHSLHYIPHPGFRKAVSDYLDAERRSVASEQDFLRARTPFRRSE